MRTSTDQPTRFPCPRRAGVIALSAAALAIGAVGSSASAAGPLESNPTVDAARQGLAGYLAAQPATSDQSQLELDVCPLVAEADLVAPLSFFGPAEVFDGAVAEIDSEYGDDGSLDLIGVTCEVERSAAPVGGLIAAGIGVWDFAGQSDMASAVNSLPVTGAHDTLGGSMHGYCETDADAHVCYQFWSFDGVVVGMFAGFEGEDSQKDPLTSVGLILSDQLPTLLSSTAALTQA